MNKYEKAVNDVKEELNYYSTSQHIHDQMKIIEDDLLPGAITIAEYKAMVKGLQKALQDKDNEIEVLKDRIAIYETLGMGEGNNE